MFSSAAQFLYIFLDLQFFLCVLLNRILPKEHKKFGKFIFLNLSAAAKIAKLLQKGFRSPNSAMCTDGTCSRQEAVGRLPEARRQKVGRQVAGGQEPGGRRP